ncbi:hypothetical protein EDB80DRAFT_214292 [Ilyonectria destructans]|nr:hypothetical protein EDB80DRAFT_214292 [Ilyonectria destructans]
MQPFDISVSHPIPPIRISVSIPISEIPIDIWSKTPGCCAESLGEAGHGRARQVRAGQGRSGQGEDEALAKCKCKCRCSSILTMGSLPADEGAAAAVQLIPYSSCSASCTASSYHHDVLGLGSVPRVVVSMWCVGLVPVVSGVGLVVMLWRLNWLGPYLVARSMLLFWCRFGIRPPGWWCLSRYPA